MAEGDSPGKSRSLVAEVDKAAKNGKGTGNSRFIDPHVEMPERLREFQYALAVPCPTRNMTRETGLAFANMRSPMFGNYLPLSPDSLEVGEARNRCVELAVEANVQHIMFVDYDVTPPPNAVIQLMSRKVPICAGVYHLKQVPSYPLIYVKGWPGAFEDYEKGDLIKADGVGMGCTLIDMDVFRNIDPPWFRTVPGYVEENPNAILGHMTEDIYFCTKARDAGYEIIVDTSVQAGHVDSRTAIEYLRVDDPNDPRRGVPGWRYFDPEAKAWVYGSVAVASHPGIKYAKTDRPPLEEKEETIRAIDLGSGGYPAPGYTGIDLFAKGPGLLDGDISDLGWFRAEYGLVERIRSSHSLEHMSHRDIPRIFRDWTNTLVPGGELEIRVPDGEYHMRSIIERIDAGEDVDPQCDWLNATIYGLQIGEGQEHKTLFTKNRLQQLAVTSGLQDVTVERVVHDGDSANVPKTAELVLTARRAKMPSRPGRQRKKRSK